MASFTRTYDNAPVNVNPTQAAYAYPAVATDATKNTYIIGPGFTVEVKEGLGTVSALLGF